VNAVIEAVDERLVGRWSSLAFAYRVMEGADLFPRRRMRVERLPLGV